MKMQDDDDIDCPICMCELYTESVLTLETCDHVFHKECLLEYIKNKVQFIILPKYKSIILLSNYISLFFFLPSFYFKGLIYNQQILERKALIVCPDENCKIEILVDDFKQLLGKEMYENYIKYSLESYVDEHGDEVIKAQIYF